MKEDSNNLWSFVVSAEGPIHQGTTTLEDRHRGLSNGDFADVKLPSEEAGMCCDSLERVIQHYRINDSEKLARLRVYADWVIFTPVESRYAGRVWMVLRGALNLEWQSADDRSALEELCEKVLAETELMSPEDVDMFETPAPVGMKIEIEGVCEGEVVLHGSNLMTGISQVFCLHNRQSLLVDSEFEQRVQLLEIWDYPERIKVDVCESPDARLAKYPQMSNKT